MPDDNCTISPPREKGGHWLPAKYQPRGDTRRTQLDAPATVSANASNQREPAVPLPVSCVPCANYVITQRRREGAAARARACVAAGVAWELCGRAGVGASGRGCVRACVRVCLCVGVGVPGT